MLTWRRSLAAAAALLLTACTSTTRGSGRTAGPSETSSPTSSSPISSSPATPDTSTAAFPPPDLGRSPRSTAIGDPATADLCAAVGLTPFADLDASLTPAFDAEQYPPGCSITLSDATGPVLVVSVFAARHRPAAAGDPVQRESSGLPVYRYPFDEADGGCRRDVVARGVVLVADALARGSAPPSRGLSCAATRVMAARMAAAVAAGSVGRLAVAEPSVTELDACAVARRAGITSVGSYATAKLVRRGFAVNCELTTDDAFLFINATLADEARAAPGTPITVGGQQLFRSAARAGFCSYASVQEPAAAGFVEWVTATATARGSGAPPHDLCDDTAQALALYLTTAGLH